MKTIFTPQEIMSNRGCYDRDQVEALSFYNQPEIHLKTILNSETSCLTTNTTTN
jgi:hypothetical protein